MNKKFSLRLGAALLKDAVAKVMGDRTLEVLADAAPGDVANRLDAWLGTEAA